MNKPGLGRGVVRVRHAATADERAARDQLAAAARVLREKMKLPADAPDYAQALYARQEALLVLLREQLPELRG